MLGRVSDIDLRLLRVFVSVVEAGGFSLATARLNVAESTISTHMSDLEARLGIRLCERGRGGFRITQRGQEVYQETLALFDHMDRYRERLALVKTHVGGTSRIGIADSIISHQDLPLAKWITHLTDQNPDMSIEIIMDTPRALERRLLDDELHCAIAPEHRRIAGIDFHLLATERNLFFCGKSHPFFPMADENISVEMIEAQGTIARGYIDRFDEDFFQPESHRAVVHQIEAAAILILSGRYLGFLPTHFAESHVAAGQMRPLKQDEICLDIPFGLAVKKGREKNPFIDSVLRDLEKGLFKSLL
jgi:DNA-binding transcriptional LysR family regulator